MIRLLLTLVVAAAAFAVKADDSTRLRMEEQLYLLTLPVAPADDPAVETLRRDFELMRGDMQVDLRVITGRVFAQALFGRIVVLNTRLASMPSGERLFIVAHEIAHIAHRDYERWHEERRTVDDAADSARSWQQELDADAYALRAIMRYGYDLETAVSQFMRFGVQQDGPTHPGTRKRVSHLREVADSLTP